MYRVQPRRIRTAVLARRTPARAHALLRRVVAIVARVRGAARVVLEGVQQAEPMADLVHGRLALVVADDRGRGVGHAAGEDVAAVGGVVDGGELVRVAVVGVRDVGGEGAVAEEGGAGAVGVGVRGQVRLEVEVQVGVGASAQGLFHRRAVGVGGPVVADAVRGRVEVEGDVGWAVGLVQDCHLWVRSRHGQRFL